MPNSRTYQSSAGTAMLAMFDEYAKFNPREMPELVTKQSAELAGNLYLAAPRSSPTEIQNKLDSLGARFKRAPRAYAQKVGPKAKAFFTANASSKEAAARKARSKAKRTNAKRAKIEKKAPSLPKLGRQEENVAGLRKGLTLTEEKFAAAKLRIGRRGALAASFVPAMKKFGSKLTVAKGARGKANEWPSGDGNIAGGTEFVTGDITSYEAGAAAQADKTHFVDTAFAATAANMEVYIKRKKAEIDATFSRAAAKAK